MKSVKVAACGMKFVDSDRHTIRITGVHFSYNKTKRDGKNFLETIPKIQNVLKIWRMRSLTLEGKVIVFKTLAILKIVYLSMTIKVPTEIIVQLVTSYSLAQIYHLTTPMSDIFHAFTKIFC